MKKVLIVIRALTHGGAEKSLISFLNTLDESYLEREKIQIDLLLTVRGEFFDSQLPGYVRLVECPKDYAMYCNPLKESIKRGEITFQGLLKKIYSMVCKMALLKKSGLSSGELQWKMVGSTLKQLKDNYDVAIAYFHDASAYYIIEKVNADRKIIWIHNEYEKLGYTNDFQRTFYEKASQLVTISNRCVGSLAKHFPDMKGKINMIENITSTKLIKQMAQDFYPEEYIDNEHVIKILSIGRLVPQKGYDLGIAAFEKIKEKKFHWYIIGAGDLEEELKKQVDECGLNDNISFLGLRVNPYPYIDKCDVFFQPSRFEGKSIALDEAIILGKPIVATNYDTVYDSIDDSINGIICDMNSEKIAEALSLIIENSALREKLKSTLLNENHGNENEIEKYLKMII